MLAAAANPYDDAGSLDRYVAAAEPNLPCRQYFGIGSSSMLTEPHYSANHFLGNIRAWVSFSSDTTFADISDKLDVDKVQEYLRIRRSLYFSRGMREWPWKFNGRDWTAS